MRIFNKNKLVLKSVIIIILSMSFSSTTFAGEHFVSTWDDYKESIREDLFKQDTNIRIHYEGNDSFKSAKALKGVVSNLYDEVISEIDGAVEGKNIRNVRLKTKGEVKSRNDYVLNSGTYEVTYKNSNKDMKKVQSVINRFIKNNINESMTDYEKIRASYNFVIGEYVYGFSSKGSKNQRELNERNMVLGLQQKPVVCEAYAMLFSKVVTTLGYNNEIVTGTATINKEGHAWNLIEIDNNWYHVDATWGDSEDEELRDKYFLTSDDVMESREDLTYLHSWNKSKYYPAYELYQSDGSSLPLKVSIFKKFRRSCIRFFQKLNPKYWL